MAFDTIRNKGRNNQINPKIMLNRHVIRWWNTTSRGVGSNFCFSCFRNRDLVACILKMLFHSINSLNHGFLKLQDAKTLQHLNGEFHKCNLGNKILFIKSKVIQQLKKSRSMMRTTLVISFQTFSCSSINFFQENHGCLNLQM